MLIEKKISDYLVFENEPILRALEKINKNKRRLLFVIGESGRLLGAFSDGDFRRWLTRETNVSLNQEIAFACNRNVKFTNVNTAAFEIESLFSPDIDMIPLVDDFHRLVAVAMSKEKGVIVGGKKISEESGAYIIAEIGNNHQGDIDLAKKLVDLVVETGADCVKFQMRDMASLYKSGRDKDAAADLGAQYTMDLLNKFQLNNDQLIEVFDYAKSKNITPLCTPWDLKSLNVLEDYGMEAYKVASADLTNIELLTALVQTNKPLFCSTGMSTESEIKQASNFLNTKGANFVILHCNSTYPTPLKDVNLAYLPRLREITGAIVGYSGHERGINIPLAAVAMGCKVIEKHFTLDKTQEGNDHKVSLLPTEFARMVREIRELEEAIGGGGERTVTQGEMMNREVLAKSLVSNRQIKVGEEITNKMIEVKSPGQGLQPLYRELLIGKIANRQIESGDFFFESDLEKDTLKPRNYSFCRPFGIPVRYHDYFSLAGKTNLDFVEFHLSYQDLAQDLDLVFSEPQRIGFAVHSPELFENDHIIDLASTVNDYRLRSISELNRVCDITRKLKKYFPKTERPVIVLNAGGFSQNGFLSVSDRSTLYARVADSLTQVEDEGVEVIIQTMPPFPWHFGGQSHHNIFVEPEEIAVFCSRYGYRICYDISHSMMTCNYLKIALTEFTEKVGKYIAHIHVVDAKGIDGEGVQIGNGDVNFVQLEKDLHKHAKNIMFLPEVWQGHKNSGAGFWQALEYLESINL